MVIGLEIAVNTWVDVQVYNSAGLGPRSEAYIMETSGDGEYSLTTTPSAETLWTFRSSIVSLCGSSE